MSKITSAIFVKGLQGTDSILEDGKPQVAFIGRSNVGKSSLINSLTGEKNLARTSSTPGRTQELNVFLINKSVYLVDLPGYGFAKASHQGRERLEELIHWYLFNSPYVQKKVVIIIDAEVGPTAGDLEMLQRLIGRGKRIIVVANKVDKIPSSKYKSQLKKIQSAIGVHITIPYSSITGVGVSELATEILK